MRYKEIWEGYAPDNVSVLKMWFDSAMKFMTYKIVLFGEDFTLWQLLVYFTLLSIILRFLFKLFK